MIRRLIAQIFQPSFMPFVGVGGNSSGYKIGKSLRTRASASGYLSRTPSSSGNRRTWTWSAWVKRGALGSMQHLFNAWGGNSDSLNTGCYFSAANKLVISGFTVNWRITTRTFTDVASWYHIVICYDGTDAGAFSKWKVYVNGIQVTAFDTATDPGLNSDLAIGHNITHRFGTTAYDGSGPLDAYLSDFHFVDGQALTPNSFGAIEATTGQWVPKRYSGTYGLNGFYLDFKDGTSLTTLGQDKSGNGNDWALNNVSLTSGATYDWMHDTPSNNYPVLNPLNAFNISLLNANLSVSGNTASYFSRSTIPIPKSGGWYCEVQVVNATNLIVGLASEKFSNNSNLGQAAGEIGVYWNGQCLKTNVAQPGTWPGFSIGDIIGISCDADAKDVSFYRNGSAIGSAVSYADFNEAFFSVGTYLPGGQAAINFGQRPFEYAPPGGFKALSTKSLPKPLIVNPKTQFKAITYAGTGSPPMSISGIGFRPAFLWVKSRSSAYDNCLFNKASGVGGNYLVTNKQQAEGADGTTWANLASFDADGFTAGITSNTNVLTTPGNYAAWAWRSDLPLASNANGSIVSQHVVNPLSGFSIVSYTGTGINSTVGHGLLTPPDLIIIKSRSGAASWLVYSSVAGPTAAIALNANTALVTSPTYFNNTAPTSSVFSIGTNGELNTSSAAYIAYCFSNVEGFSKVGSYTGNGSANGPFVHCGFTPAFIMIKRLDGTSDWNIFDSARSPFNAPSSLLKANAASAESAFVACDFLSNGFKVRTADNSFNGSGARYLFVAFAESPFKTSNAR